MIYQVESPSIVLLLTIDSKSDRTHILHYSQERALRPVPQRVDFLVEQASCLLLKG
ncbi:hypothetical protein QUB75_24300 [Microcoleus sp. K1-B6]|uniref:hypothetical protein n=1 Tax=unclassified Microcoleus TaxID=2642155 RepID=UPI002FD55C0B